MTSGYRQIMGIIGSKRSFILIVMLLFSYTMVISCDKEDEAMDIASEINETHNTPANDIKKTGYESGYGYEISKPTFEKPIVIMANYDANATPHDNLYIGYSSIVQVTPSLYYMYYESLGDGSYTNNSIQELSFAYSTDGIHWIREIPSGIEEPVPGTNLIFDWRNDKARVVEQDVVKVLDSEYPFRMIASKGPDTMSQTVNMWKSKDGIHFEQMRVLLNAKHDTQVSVIVRGNILKVYLRMRKNGGNSTRQIGVAYFDLDGNILSPATTLFGDNYYQAGASILDDRRELLLPTYFDEKNDKSWYDAYIVEGTNISHVDTNINEALLNSEKDGWGTICPKIITIGFDQYIYYVQRNYTHAGKLIGKESDKKVEIRAARIVWDTKGKSY